MLAALYHVSREPEEARREGFHAGAGGVSRVGPGALQRIHDAEGDAQRRPRPLRPRRTGESWGLNEGGGGAEGLVLWSLDPTTGCIKRGTVRLFRLLPRAFLDTHRLLLCRTLETRKEAVNRCACIYMRFMVSRVLLCILFHRKGG